MAIQFRHGFKTIHEHKTDGQKERSNGEQVAKPGKQTDYKMQKPWQRHKRFCQGVKDVQRKNRLLAQKFPGAIALAYGNGALVLFQFQYYNEWIIRMFGEDIFRTSLISSCSTKQAKTPFF